MSFIFGPVPSRRLGLSLGVDLIPPKTCTYDCLYCQVGKTTQKTVDIMPYAPLKAVLEELEKRLEKITPDVITLSGSGEPTLHSGINEVITFTKGITEIKTAILTNGSLLWKEEVRERISEADIVMPTLSTVFEKTFRAIHRPHPGLDLQLIIEGLINFRRIFRGQLALEVVFLDGFNDSSEEIEGLKGVIDNISPDRIQINTVVRPPADSRAKSLDRQRLEDIRDFFGEKAEIIADVSPEHKDQEYDSLIAAILEMAKRRPVRVVDMASVLNLEPEDVEGLVKGLHIKGLLKKREHSGEIFYITPD